MDIAALSIGMSQMNLRQQASLSVMKIAMDTAKGQSADLVNMLDSTAINTTVKAIDQSVTPHLGGTIDISL